MRSWPITPSGKTVLRMELGNAGPGLRYLNAQVMQFRRNLESELLAQHDALTPWQSKLVRTACKALRLAMRCDRLLAKHPDDSDAIEHSTRLAYMDRAQRFEEACDKALKALGLDQQKTEWTDWLTVENGADDDSEEEAENLEKDAKSEPAADDSAQEEQAEEEQEED